MPCAIMLNIVILLAKHIQVYSALPFCCFQYTAEIQKLALGIEK